MSGQDSKRPVLQYGNSISFLSSPVEAVADDSQEEKLSANQQICNLW
jgi:hypothetical protein